MQQVLWLTVDVVGIVLLSIGLVLWIFKKKGFSLRAWMIIIILVNLMLALSNLFDWWVTTHKP